ncbi:MAG: PH domain-containing protein [Candidatus Poribacteria bacterium]
MALDVGDDRTADYAPRRPWRVTVGLWVVVALLIAAAFAVNRGEMSYLVKTAISLLYGVIIIFCLSLLYGLRYTLSDEALCARVGPVQMRVPLEDITSVKPGWIKKYNTWRWALTPTGLAVARRDRRIRIGVSPDDREEFLRDLGARCPHLEACDGGLESRE